MSKKLINKSEIFQSENCFFNNEEEEEEEEQQQQRVYQFFCFHYIIYCLKIKF
jgi:hypothetical protein